MKTSNTEGCGLCNATWGEYYREIDGDRMFFCCNICADIFETMVRKVKEATGWDKIDYVDLKGNYSLGRNCVAKNGKDEFKYYFVLMGTAPSLHSRKDRSSTSNYTILVATHMIFFSQTRNKPQVAYNH